VFSKWPTIVKISRGFLARSAGNSDFFKNKKILKIHEARKMDEGADDKSGYFFTWPNAYQLNFSQKLAIGEIRT
jgi:hypothetical protein